MKNFEAFLKIKKIAQEAEANIPRLKEKLRIHEQNQADLDMKANKAKALEEKNWKEKAKLAEENEKAMGKLRIDLESAEKTVEGLKEELKKLESAALNDIRNHYRGPHEKAVRELFKILQEARRLEEKVVKIKEEAKCKGHEISYLPYTLLPPLPRILIQKEGELEEYSPLNRFKRDAEQQGIKFE